MSFSREQLDAAFESMRASETASGAPASPAKGRATPAAKPDYSSVSSAAPPTPPFSILSAAAAFFARSTKGAGVSATAASPSNLSAPLLPK